MDSTVSRYMERIPFTKWEIAGLAFALWFAQHLVRFFEALKTSRGMPSYVALFRPYFFWASVLFPYHPRISYQRPNVWQDKADFFHKYNSTVVAVVSLFPPCITFMVADPEAFHKALNDKQSYQKTIGCVNKVTNVYGENIFNLHDGTEHKRHRKIASPAFSEANNKEVWKTAKDVITQWCRDTEANGDVNGLTVVSKVESVTKCMTLMVLGRAGFGQNFGWEALKEKEASPNSKMSFFRSLQLVASEFVPIYILPKWAFVLPNAYLQLVKSAFSQFEGYTLDIINNGRQNVDERRNDLLRLFVKANSAEASKNALIDSSLLSNIYVFMLAGHETTSSNLACLLLFLCTAPDVQDAIHEEISEQISSLDDFTYDLYPKLARAQRAIKESLRLASPVPAIQKQAVLDSTLPARTCPIDSSTPSQSFQLVVPKGSYVNLAYAAAHYIPGTFPDPYTFNPDRWIDESANGSSHVFSGGVRSCIGRAFANIELTVIVSLLMYHFKIEPPPHRKAEFEVQPGESTREWRERLMNVRVKTSVVPRQLELAFRRRH